jgi:hypothetical protein
MTRRTIGLLVTLALSLLVAPLGAEAPPAGKVYRIGWLYFGTLTPWEHWAHLLAGSALPSWRHDRRLMWTGALGVPSQPYQVPAWVRGVRLAVLSVGYRDSPWQRASERG